MPTETCPPPEKLEDLRANRLGRAEADALRQHLDECPGCRVRVSGPTPAGDGFPFLSPPRAPGELGWLGGHRVLGVLGEGGMSVVFDAEDPALHRRVALKVLKPKILDPVTRERFLREARVLAQLPPEHIVTVHQVGEANGVPYLALERLEGESLDSRLRRDRWLPVGEAVQLARQAAEGLEVAHEKGLVHRDVKPANLWLEGRDGRVRRVKLIDFGIARVLTQDGAGLTMMGSTLGTPGYMAPEQAAGLPADARSDLYGLGCVLFHMLTGGPPFADGGDTRSLLAAAAQGDTPQVREVAPRLPPPVAALIQQLLSRNPADRPASARAVAERLRQLGHDDRAPLGPLPTARAAAAPPRRSVRQPGVIGIWVGVVALTLALVVSIVAATGRFSPPGTGSGDGGGGGAAGPPIKIGLLLSQNGGSAVHEKPILQALQLAVKEVNEAGGVLGRPVEPVIGNGASDEDTFAAEARRLIERDGVVALFGCWSSASRKRVAAVCEEHDRLLFYPAGYEGLEASPAVVYLGGTPNQTVVPLVRWARSHLHKKRFFLVGSEYVYSKVVAEVVKHEVRGLDAEVVGQDYQPLGADDFDDVARAIKDTKADIVINSVDETSNPALLRALRGAGIRPPDVPTVWLNIGETELSLYSADGLAGDYSAANYFESITRAENRAFRDRFHKQFGSLERVSDPMQTGYFGVHLWKKAAEAAGTTDTAPVRRALRGLAVDAPENRLPIDKDVLHAWRIGRVGKIVKSGSHAHFEMVYRSAYPLPPDPYPGWKSREEWDKFLGELYAGWGNRWEKYDAADGGGPP
jgi:urea transport system substrate-binding protein